MKIEETEKSLRQFLRTKGLPLKALSAQDVLRIATEFWQSTSIDGVRPDKGDGLVAYFELMDRGRGTLYEFGINRILRMPPPTGADFWEWVPGYKLRLSIAFKPSIEVFRLKPGHFRLLGQGALTSVRGGGGGISPVSVHLKFQPKLVEHWLFGVCQPPRRAKPRYERPDMGNGLAQRQSYTQICQ